MKDKKKSEKPKISFELAQITKTLSSRPAQTKL